MKSGLVDVRVAVVDSLSRVASGEKEGLHKLAVHQPGKARGEISAADVLAWGDLGAAAQRVPTHVVIDLCNLGISHNEKSGFSLRWLRQSCTRDVPESCRAEMTASLAGRNHCRSLSSYTPSGTDFAACRATLVSLPICSAFVAAEDARKFPREDMWEAPLCTIANVGSLIRCKHR